MTIENNQRKIVGLMGFAGCGKSTFAKIMVEEHGFNAISFAGPLKDAVSAIFGWPRELLEGDTKESREFRESVDDLWQSEIGDHPLFSGKKITPRLVLQIMGTEVFRVHFHSDIWVLSALNKIKANPEKSYVITDVRFRTEIKLLESINGSFIRIRRGEEPEWYDCAKNSPEMMPVMYKNIHSSEYDWISHGAKIVVENDGTIDDLKKKANLLFP